MGGDDAGAAVAPVAAVRSPRKQPLAEPMPGDQGDQPAKPGPATTSSAKGRGGRKGAKKGRAAKGSVSKGGALTDSASLAPMENARPLSPLLVPTAMGDIPLPPRSEPASPQMPTPQ